MPGLRKLSAPVVGVQCAWPLELVKEGRAQACVSAGNTGALMGLAKLLLKPLEGIERPALVTVLPHQQKGKNGGPRFEGQRRL